MIGGPMAAKAIAAKGGIGSALVGSALPAGVSGPVTAGILGAGGKLGTAAKLGLAGAGGLGLAALMGKDKTPEQEKLGVDPQSVYDMGRLYNQKMGGAFTDEELNVALAPLLSQYGGEYETIVGPQRKRRPMFEGLNYSGLTRLAADGGSIKPKKKSKALKEEQERLDAVREAVIEDMLFSQGINEDVMFDMMRRQELNPVGRKDGGLMQLAMSDPDPMAERSDMMENIALDKFGKPLSRLTDDEIIQIEEMIENMMPMANGGAVSNMTDMINKNIDQMQEGLTQQMQEGFTTQEAIVPANAQAQLTAPAAPTLQAQASPSNFAIAQRMMSMTPQARRQIFMNATPVTIGNRQGNLGQLRALMGYANGGSIPQTNNVPNGMQIDGRGGGFIPMGARERKDDVPAMLAKNEFVMTADAVRGMGNGDVNEGAQRMYDLMNNLESKV